MASRKELKKDIEFLVSEVVSECYTYMYFHPEKNQEKIVEIIGEIIGIRNDLITRVNHPDGKDNPKLVRAHFNTITKDLKEKVIASLDKIGKLETK